jgi:hypothetical protein
MKSVIPPAPAKARARELSKAGDYTYELDLNNLQ